jgi:membrane-associated phospholipid phosphatase
LKLNTKISPLARKLWIWGVSTGAVTLGLMAWADVPIALYFHTYRDTAWANFFAAITDFANGAIWYALALIGISAAYLRRKVLRATPDTAGLTKDVRAWLFMIASMATSGVLINVIKFSVGRERPRFLFREGSADFHPFALRIADCSFPSGHTQSIWAAMLCLSFLFPGMRPVFFLVAVLISASRFIIGAHYLADVVASIFIATAITMLWRQWFERDGVSVKLWGSALRT